MSIRKFCNVAYKHGTYMIKYKPNKLCLLFFNHDNIMNIVYAKSTILKLNKGEKVDFIEIKVDFIEIKVDFIEKKVGKMKNILFKHGPITLPHMST